jgi:hypothetical protein
MYKKYPEGIFTPCVIEDDNDGNLVKALGVTEKRSSEIAEMVRQEFEKQGPKGSILAIFEVVIPKLVHINEVIVCVMGVAKLQIAMDNPLTIMAMLNDIMKGK